MRFKDIRADGAVSVKKKIALSCRAFTSFLSKKNLIPKRKRLKNTTLPYVKY